MSNFHLYLSKLGIKHGTPEATKVASAILDQQNENARKGAR